MSSDPFDLLGLDRATATDADVRRAYAAKLKVTRPEDDRAGFMALRAAFEHARIDVRWRDGYADYEKDRSPPDGRDPSTVYLGEPAVAEMDKTPAVPPDPPEAAVTEAALPEMAEDAPSGADEDADALDEEDADTVFGDRIGPAIDRLVDTLTATGRAPKVREVMAIIDGADVAGIEEYQSMQWQVRQFLCDRTGYNLEPQELRVPDWLTLEVFDALDQYYGWTRQPVTQIWVRRLNDWMARVRREAALGAMPRVARKRAVIEESKTAPPQEKGSQIWLWIGAGILISQLVRFFTSGGGGD